jgi:hypothetical protein
MEGIAVLVVLDVRVAVNVGMESTMSEEEGE